jgi:hypothetical protein
MQIKYANNGRVDHVENHLARALINAGLAEPVEPPKAKPAAPQWRVIVTQGRELAIHVPSCHVPSHLPSLTCVRLQT